MTHHPSSNKEKEKERDLRIKILKEIASSGGLPQNRVSLEVLYLLPTEFIEAYTTLFFSALREDAKGTDLEARAGEATDKALSKLKYRKTGKSEIASQFKQSVGGPVGPIHGEGAKRYRNAWTIRSEKALGLKGEVDRKLRQLSVDIESGLKPEGKVVYGKKCQGAGCGKFVKNEWRYCPSCGASLRKLTG